MKCVITGSPEKGLGKIFGDHFSSKGIEVVFIRSKDTKEQVLEKIKGCNLFINNAYMPNNGQVKILSELSEHVNMIVIGSLASTFPDSRSPTYSMDKRNLQNVFYNKCITFKENGPRRLLLSISRDAYNDPEIILKTVDFWIENPNIVEIKFGLTVS